MTNWLEISLTVNGELAEAVADVLARYAPNGVVTEQSVDFVNDEDEGTPVGDITVRAYLPADEHLEETRQQVEKALFYLSMIQPLPAPVYTPVADQNWMEAWKARYQPIPIGKRLIIIPAWLEPSDSNRIPVKIDPGMAFGTGTHPTTQLCLEFIDELLEPHSASARYQSVIDVGCGSGILSIAALKLGVQVALGVDIDPASVQASRENATTNGIGGEFIVAQGSVGEVLAGKFPLKQAPLVLANILAPVLIRLLDDGLANLLLPGGTLMMSGILQGQAESVIQAAQAKGLKQTAWRQRDDWVALAFQP
jgi:ribosomal protein L11 methyltransferase